jgi:carbonic anhydrase
MNRHSRSRRWFVALGAAASMVMLSSAATPPATSQKHEQFLVTANQAIQRLLAGNARFVAHRLSHPHQDSGRLAEVAGGQEPIAVVLSCADSRLPPEVIFDQGLGDIFTVRVAGNIAAPDVIGSIEYAVEHLGVPLIVVLGHEKCGAVSAAMAGGEAGNHIHVLVDAIAPVVAEAKRDTKDPVDAAVRLNVEQVVGQLEHSQPTLARAVAAGHLKVVGAYYSLDHGTVTLLSGARP